MIEALIAIQAADFLADEAVLHRMCVAFADGLFSDTFHMDPTFLQVCILPQLYPGGSLR